jgi:hypothetical protein
MLGGHTAMVKDASGKMAKTFGEIKNVISILLHIHK